MTERELQAENERLWVENARLHEELALYQAREQAEVRIRAALRSRNACHLQVSDIMTPAPRVAHLGDSLRSLLAAFREGGFRRLPVLDESEQLVGIVTDRDVRLAVNSPLVLHERWQDEMLLDHIRVDVCMTPDPITTRPDTPVFEVAQLMRERKIGGLPVLDDAGALTGIITETDLLRAFEDALRAAGDQRPAATGDPET
ncbi:MAG: CBS domain-containing protein [Anaerolineae bacterium]|nr:CBS domain-containing protein [Anaerolineae bacterium]